MPSPRVSKSLELMRKRGYLSQVVQQWIQHGSYNQSQGKAGFRFGTKRDLFNIIDVLCVCDPSQCFLSFHSTEGVQVMGDDVLPHLTKIWESPNSRIWLSSASRGLLLHSWVKRSTKSGASPSRSNGVKRWVLREKSVLLGDLDADPKEFWEQWKAEIKAEESLRKAEARSKPSSSQTKKANAERSSKKAGSSSSRSTAKAGGHASKAKADDMAEKTTHLEVAQAKRSKPRSKAGRLQRVPQKPRLEKKA